MQNMKNYLTSWKSFWKTTINDNRTLKLAPSNINFTNSTLGDLKNSIIDEQLMIDVSTKLIQSISPPKLQICEHENQWFALNNSHLLIYQQLERIGVCESVVCDIIRTEDIPIGIRQTLVPVKVHEQTNQYMIRNDEIQVVSNQNEVIYCADMQADSCGYFDDDEQLDDSTATGGISERDDDSDDDDEQNEWPIYSSNSKFDEIDLDTDSLEESCKELKSLL